MRSGFPICKAGDAIQAFVTGTTVVNGAIEPMLEMAQKKAIFHRIGIAGVARLLGSRTVLSKVDVMGQGVHFC
jgi:uncharacterized protein (DUF4213/DUF364 family)